MHYPNPPMNNEKLSQLMDGEWHELNPSDCVKGVCSDETLRGKWARYHLIRDVMKNESMQVDEQLVSRICSAIQDEPEYSNVTVFASPTAMSAESTDANIIRTADSDDDAAPVDAADEADGTIAAPHAPVTHAAVPDAKKSGVFGTGVTGLAVAASVAVMTVAGMNVWQDQSPAGDVPATQAATTSIATASPETRTVAAVNELAIAPDSVVAASGNGLDTDNAFSRQVDGAPLPVVEFVANTGSYWVSPNTAERVDHEVRLNTFLSQHLENSPTSSREGLLPYSRLVGYDERGTVPLEQVGR